MKPLRLVGIGTLVAAVVGTAALWASAARTHDEIDAQRKAVIAAARPRPAASAPQIAALPEPVQRFVRFTFPQGVPPVAWVDVRQSGMFRRPLRTDFMPTTVRQTFDANAPALLFDATTPLAPGIWARAYDAYIDGAMVMKAKVLSAVAVVDEPSSPLLDRISLRRWLLESAFYPMALLPGGAVRWEAIDSEHARAIVTRQGHSATLVATFAADGRLLRWRAEEDGDLTTPYHGSGEQVERSDYQRVHGMMIPMRFTVARVAGDTVAPFWQGQVTHIAFMPAQTTPD